MKLAKNKNKHVLLLEGQAKQTGTPNPACGVYYIRVINSR